MHTAIHHTESSVGASRPFFSPAAIQPKLTIGQPNDKYEQEADAMADKVMRMPQNLPDVQAKCAECEQEEQVQPKRKKNFLSLKPLLQRMAGQEEELQARPMVQKMGSPEEETLQTKPLMMKSEGGGGAATSTLTSKLNSSKGGGSPLPAVTNRFMSNAFGTDFSNVRVHTGSNAVQMNQGLNARAFTHGSDVYFNKGEYSPESSNGKSLLAHELTHVVQQGGGINKKTKTRSPKNSNSGFSSKPSDTPRQESFMRTMAGAPSPGEEVLLRQQKEQGHNKPSFLQAGNQSPGLAKKIQPSNTRNFISMSKGGGSTPPSCAPTLKSIKATKGDPPAMTTAWRPPTCELALGTPTNPGMTIESEVDVPKKCTGKLEYVQLVSTCREKTEASGTKMKFQTSGWVLDSSDPYASQSVSSAGAVKFKTTDSPGTPAGSRKAMKVTESFKMYLLWTPTGSTTRVGLGNVAWDWKAEATKKPSGSGCAGSWTVSNAAVTDGAGSASTTVPSWSANVTGTRWEAGTC